MNKTDIEDPLDSMFQGAIQKGVPSEEKKSMPAFQKEAVKQQPVSRQTPVAKNPQVSTILPSKNNDVGEAFRRYTVVMEKDMKKWVNNKASEIRDNHDLGRANFSNLLCFLVAKAQEKGIDHNEYINYVRENREKG